MECMQARRSFVCPLTRSDRDTNHDTRSFTKYSKLHCIVDTRWTPQLAWRCKQPCPRSRHNALSASMLAARLSLVVILKLRACPHASLGTHDTSRNASSNISEVQDSNSCTCVDGCSATTKTFAACPAAALEQLSAAKIGITNFSRSSGHETASSNSERARRLRRLLQHMPEVQSILCRANSHPALVVRGSLQEENRRQVAPQRERLGVMAGTRCSA